MYIKQFEMNMFSENTYAVWDETHEAALIDVGCFSAEEQNILSHFIEENQLKPVLLLNTHFHLDHVFGLPFIERIYGLRTHGHQDDKFLLDNLAQQCRLFGFEVNERPVPIGTYVNEGDTVRFGHTSLQAIHVPGHSPGSIVYYNADAQAAFVGDVIFRGSIGRTDLEGGNFEQLHIGIQQKLFTLPPDTTLYSGHGPATTVGQEIASNPFFR